MKRKEIFARNETISSVEDIVFDIIQDVRKNGDKALFAYAEKFDKAKLDSLVVSQEEIDDAMNNADKQFVAVIKEAIENITVFHKEQKRTGFEIKGEGTVLGQKVTPIEKVALYVPGGTAAYPSTVLMDAIPAKIALRLLK